jgi:DNA polymerase-2
MGVRGFILHPTYRIEAGRPVVCLHGRLESGEPFLIRDHRPVPHFFLREADAERARALGASRQEPTGLRTLREADPVVRVLLAVPQDTPTLRDALHAAGIATYEADVRFAIRYLIDRGLRGSLEIDAVEAPGRVGRPGAPGDVGGIGGAAASGRPALRVFEDPGIAPSDWRPEAGLLRVLSLDLETDPRGETIHSAALAGAGADEVLLALGESEAAPALGAVPAGARVRACGDEKGLLQALAARLREIDCDVLTGWNVIDFDLAVLAAAARRLGVPFEVGRAAGALRVVRDTSFWGRSRAEIPGRVVLDGIDLLKGAFVKLRDYRLDTAAREIVGEGKVALAEAGAGRGAARAQAIENAFRRDLPRFVEYNLADARLVLRILETARLVDLAVRRSLLTGMPLDRVGASIASFDFLYLGALRGRGRVAPTLRTPAGEPEPTMGGAVLEPAAGLYGTVLAFDFKSLYPSLIRTFNLDPLGHVPDPPPGESADLIRAPNGACFRREPGILPALLERLVPQREEAKRRGDVIGAHAIKILMNSFYGVLATPACRFHSGAVANAITHFGQWALHRARELVETRGHRVLYGDTDSLFVLPRGGDAPDPAATRRLGEDLCAGVNREMAKEIRSRWRVESRLELEFETLFLKFFIPSMRHGGGGARKRYAGLAEPRPGAPPEAVFVGMEVVRRDWTDLGKIFQRGLYERLFRGDAAGAVATYLREFVEDLRAGRHDDRLVYRKALRKDLDAYTATTPPHVKAARKMGGKVGVLVEYVMTGAGPEPAGAPHGPIDYEHYVEKQIRPIAEQVLPHLGLDFDRALGSAGRQGRLF